MRSFKKYISHSEMNETIQNQGKRYRAVTDASFDGLLNSVTKMVVEIYMTASKTEKYDGVLDQLKNISAFMYAAGTVNAFSQVTSQELKKERCDGESE